jgi:hypothetical protein
MVLVSIPKPDIEDVIDTVENAFEYKYPIFKINEKQIFVRINAWVRISITVQPDGLLSMTTHNCLVLVDTISDLHIGQLKKKLLELELFFV